MTRAARPRVVHCQKDPYTLYIGRMTPGIPGSKWANPFRIGSDGPREAVIAKYKAWIVGQSSLMSSLHELRGETLGCWCKPAACHGDVLVELLAERDAALAVPTPWAPQSPAR